MSNFSPWGGLGGPGEACVKCARDPTTLMASRERSRPSNYEGEENEIFSKGVSHVHYR